MIFLNKVLIFVANLAWVIVSLPSYFLFFVFSNNLKKTQSKILFRILKKNKNTKIGRRLRFDEINSIDQYFKNVSINVYEFYSGYIDSIKRGENNILTTENVIVLEPTSGSSSSSKLIPYTKSLKKEFNKGISPWIVGMYKNNLKLFFLKSYWLITPALQNRQDEDVGFEDDSEYLGVLSRYLLNYLLIIPSEVSQITDRESFFYVNLLFLIKNKDLGFISVWSPTLVPLIFEKLLLWGDSIIRDLEKGKISGIFNIDYELKTRLEKKLGVNIKRAKEIREILNNKENLGDKTIYEAVWPNLVLISCWADSSSSSHMGGLKKYFPHIKIQGKGLIATECFVSFPVHGYGGKMLSYRSHFFEFIKVDDCNRNIYLVHELMRGEKYSVIVTTSGGLYRYKLGDVIEVVGFSRGIPLINFIGREYGVSDLFGEKLNESHVASILKDVFLKYELDPIFFLVAPDINNKTGKYRYVLFIENVFDNFNSICENIDNKLRDNFHYDYCRRVGQLDDFTIFSIDGNGVQTYIDRCCDSGQKIGDVKSVILNSQLNWSKYFEGKFVK